MTSRDGWCTGSPERWIGNSCGSHWTQFLRLCYWAELNDCYPPSATAADAAAQLAELLPGTCSAGWLGFGVDAALAAHWSTAIAPLAAIWGQLAVLQLG